MKPAVPRFDRRFFESRQRFTCIGSGDVGGKAAGLLNIHDILGARLGPQEFPDFDVDIPTLAVVCTDVFDAFMERNRLRDVALSDEPDDRIASAFQRADLPVEVLGDLRSIVERVHTPLAVRSSSLLEDALYRPFAGVYDTKMIPNNQPDADARFRRLAEALKLVYASTFFRAAKSYVRTTEHRILDEKMAVIIQEVVGSRHGDRFYPHLSGVARSYSFYRIGDSRPEDGVADLALGLGKTIVDGGMCWSYSPARPGVAPPAASPRARLKESQTRFWAVNMGKPPEYDPIAETEYLVQAGLAEAEEDGVLRWTASTFDPESEVIRPGTGSPGPRVVDFAPLLSVEEKPLNALLKRLLGVCEEAYGEKVEIEFAASFGPGKVRFGFLQVRPMAVAKGYIDIPDEEMSGPRVLLSSEQVMGNGDVEGIRDVVYVKPEGFHAKDTPAIARQVERLNDALMKDGRPYLLIGFGRWGSSDPWLGIPVAWGGICGAKAVVEASLPEMDVDLSQGSHFFHNISSAGVGYFCVRHSGPYAVDWAWLAGRPAAGETESLRHVRLREPLCVKMDGRTGRGTVLRGGRPAGPRRKR